MTDKQPEALRLADAIQSGWLENVDPYKADIDMLQNELRRLHEANEKFGKRQEWWNERMFALEKQRDELLEALEDVMDRLVDRHETDEAAVAARAAIAKVEGEKK